MCSWVWLSRSVMRYYTCCLELLSYLLSIWGCASVLGHACHHHKQGVRQMTWVIHKWVWKCYYDMIWMACAWLATHVQHMSYPHFTPRNHGLRGVFWTWWGMDFDVISPKIASWHANPPSSSMRVSEGEKMKIRILKSGRDKNLKNVSDDGWKRSSRVVSHKITKIAGQSVKNEVMWKCQKWWDWHENTPKHPMKHMRWDVFEHEIIKNRQIGSEKVNVQGYADFSDSFVKQVSRTHFEVCRRCFTRVRKS